MKLQEILSLLKNTYRSVETSISCIYYENKWVNLMTCLNFTYENVDSLTQKYSKIRNLSELGKGTKFRIYKTAFSMDDAETLLNDISNGSVEIDGISICFNVDTKNYDLGGPYKNDTREWPEFYSYHNAATNVPHGQAVSINNASTDVIGYGYHDVHDAIRFLVNREHQPTSNSDFLIRTPLYARIERVFLEGNNVRIIVRYQKDFENLRLHYRYHYPNSDMPVDVSQPVVYDSSSCNVTEEDFKIWEIDAEQIDISQRSYENEDRYVSLYLLSLGSEIHNEHKNLADLIAEKYLLAKNPLAKLFLRFCSIEKFQNNLLVPQKGGKDKFHLGISDNFERFVQWLFSLCGFQSIWLGKDFEEYKNEEGKVDGSVDILCYNEKEKTLALVDCKTRVPNDTDIDSIKNLANIFGNEMKELGIKIIPIIVSSVEVSATKEKFAKNGVKIIDVNSIKKIIDELNKKLDPRFLLDVEIYQSTGSHFGINPYY